MGRWTNEPKIRLIASANEHRPRSWAPTPVHSAVLDTTGLEFYR